MKNMEIMKTFTTKNIPNLDVCVLAALELFSQTKLPKLNIPFKRPLVVGSGNAAATGKIIFENKDAIFADESTFENKLKSIKSIDGVVLISASGGKHAPIIAKQAKKSSKRVILITNNVNAEAKKFVDKTYTFPKNKEPYTYNTSTYMGPIIGMTKENPKKILEFINNLPKFKNFKKYKKYYFLIPEEFTGVIRLLNVKFIELFGREFSRDIETFEYIKHATTVVPSKNQLFVSFGKKMDSIYGKPQLHIPLPKNVNYASMMAISYYIVGQIQKAHTPYFKKNIVKYMKKASKVFDKKMSAIVK